MKISNRGKKPFSFSPLCFLIFGVVPCYIRCGGNVSGGVKVSYQSSASFFFLSCSKSKRPWEFRDVTQRPESLIKDEDLEWDVAENDNVAIKENGSTAPPLWSSFTGQIVNIHVIFEDDFKAFSDKSRDPFWNLPRLVFDEITELIQTLRHQPCPVPSS
ncbi:hypothetical protein SESBI_01737 [Sesbania bispinosa]|nr:hypothetical protein SESBI_01737 [Sesbania bispinosa]